jgi:hypothetical protein
METLGRVWEVWNGSCKGLGLFVVLCWAVFLIIVVAIGFTVSWWLTFILIIAGVMATVWDVMMSMFGINI